MKRLAVALVLLGALVMEGEGGTVHSLGCPDFISANQRYGEPVPTAEG